MAEFMDAETAEGSTRALAAMLPGAVAEEVVRVIKDAAVTQGRSPQLGELVKAVCRAKLKFGALLKDREANIPGKEGKPGYKYGYATLAAVADATDQFIAEEELNIFYSAAAGQGWFAVTTEIFHSSEQFKSCTVRFELPRENVGPQGIGKLLTYGRRYGKLCILDLAPTAEEDNDAGDVQGQIEGSSKSEQPSVEALVALARADPRAAFAAVRKAVAAAQGRGDISEPRLNRLYTIADKSGWSRGELDVACSELLGAPPARIPWPAYELAVEAFREVAPAALRPPAAPPASAAPPAQPAAGAPPQPPAEPVPPPTWPGAWAIIKESYGQLSAEAAADIIDKKTVAAVLEGFGRNGWQPEEIEAVLHHELGIGAADLPKDGSHPAVFRMIAKAFRLFRPLDVPAEERDRYGMAEAPQAPALQDILGRIPAVLPATADGAWGELRAALAAITEHHPDALVPVSPEDRITLLGQRSRNGNRSSGDVAGLMQHHLGIQVERLPAVLFEPVLNLLGGFPSRSPGREEVLGRLPADPRKEKPTALRDILHALIRDGIISDDEVPRSGANSTVNKEDMAQAVERVRERALTEAGHAS
jgi:hypothetical protein